MQSKTKLTIIVVCQQKRLIYACLLDILVTVIYSNRLILFMKYDTLRMNHSNKLVDRFALMSTLASPRL